MRMSSWHTVKIHDGIEYGITDHGDEYWEAEIQHVDEHGHATDLIAVKVIHDEEQLLTEVHYLTEEAKATPDADRLIAEARTKLVQAVNEELETAFE